jgi:hypothetical protein
VIRLGLLAFSFVCILMLRFACPNALTSVTSRCKDKNFFTTERIFIGAFSVFTLLNRVCRCDVGTNVGANFASDAIVLLRLSKR